LALQWIWAAIATLAGILALAAFFRSRRLARRIERLAESYWELRYQQGQLDARLARLEGAGNGEHQAGGSAAFVPLSSLKKT
jgi:hypothetical protein